MDDMRAFHVTVAGDSDPRYVVICSNLVSESQEGTIPIFLHPDSSEKCEGCQLPVFLGRVYRSAFIDPRLSIRVYRSANAQIEVFSRRFNAEALFGRATVRYAGRP